MNSDGVWTVLWIAAAFVTVVVTLGGLAVAWARWRFPSLAIRVATTVLVLAALPASWWMVEYLVQPTLREANSHDLWIHPSPIIFGGPATLGLIVGGIYSRYLHQKDGGRVA